jgi:hypothetical protein
MSDRYPTVMEGKASPEEERASSFRATRRRGVAGERTDRLLGDYQAVVREELKLLTGSLPPL